MLSDTVLTLKKELRIMRSPEDASQLSQQVFWNKKIQVMRDCSVFRAAQAKPAAEGKLMLRLDTLNA